jgi:hypothetical protein
MFEWKVLFIDFRQANVVLVPPLTTSMASLNVALAPCQRAAGTKRRLQVGISQFGNFAGWNFAGCRLEFRSLGILQVGILQVRNFAGWKFAGCQELCRLLMQT